MKSTHAVVIIAVVWFLLGSFYYSKWEKQYHEATISWDVSGYYHYLPAIFIYKDIRQQDWMHEINTKYLPSPAFDQAVGHNDSGNKVNKYMAGQAVLYTPFFLVSHMYASISKTYPADGYSKPYQVGIWFGSLLFSILGLLLLRILLLKYFNDQIVLLTLIALGLGTHWMEYASINNAMNHGWLFTLLCILILSTIRFYKQSDWLSVLGIGTSLGLAMLVRPTEAIWIMVPLLWGMSNLKERFSILLQEWKKVIAAVIISGFLVSIQLMYWKYAAGEWIVYTYADQGFNWLHPKIWRGLMGVRIGWWIYTPLMFLAMFGWYGLYKKHQNIFWSCFVTSILAVYITLSWSHFDSGGGLGQRNLIQIYPLMAFPLAIMIDWFIKNKYGKWILFIIIGLNLYYTGWWMHQAHKGGFFQAGQTTTPYFYKVVGRFHPNKDYLKLLDTREYFDGNPKATTLLYENDFEQDTAYFSLTWPGGDQAICLNGEYQSYGPIEIPITSSSCQEWLRCEAEFMIQSREWTGWKYTQWIVQFYRGEEVIKSNVIRLQRLITEDHIRSPLFFDVKIPTEAYDRCTMTVWNATSEGQVLMDNLKVSCF